MVQWFRHGIFTAGDWGSIPGQGTEIPQVARHRQKKKKKKKKNNLPKRAGAVSPVTDLLLPEAAVDDAAAQVVQPLSLHDVVQD